ncbi:hypothetical protein ABE28_009130 [Peribacillus muralis]|uniref:IstB-like ATP-binding domain-containing protein n=1 Tax=Peribacillus muralis TaxID=264697 RepID=A0A1B3XMR7_9BACI|nr:ATP-binding protein [Peribacillus muralis]AOH54514.1 hypothetical protein ABE28_009130 [Peribacillus muralis]
MFLDGFRNSFCWYCEEIKGQDWQLAKETELIHQRNQIRGLYEEFAENSLINEKLKKATFANYVPPSPDLDSAKHAYIDFVKNYDPDNPQSLLVIGNYGTGKSHLAVAATKEFMKQEKSALFIQVNKLFTKITSTWNKNSELTEGKLMEIIASVELLVIDDFGAEFTEKDKSQITWKVTKMNEIIDSRCGKSTIFTTNFTISELSAMYGERDFSRMIQDADPIEMYGDNYRLRKFQKEKGEFK